MPTSSLRDKAVSYSRLYAFLRKHHPEILEEYRNLVSHAKEKALGIYNASLEES